MKNHDMDIKTEKSSREPKVLFGAFVADGREQLLLMMGM